MTFLENLEPLLRAFWYIALPVSLFFLLQTIMTFVGFGGSDMETTIEGESNDFGDTPFELFTLRNLINFLLGFSWSGISFYTTFENKAIVILIATIIGAVFVALFFFIIKQMMKLNENNSFSTEKTLNKTATVYITIPEKKSGTGKIQISINGSFHELEAITENDAIETGAVVKVAKIENNIIIVEKI
ncbi:NfeD family protein [Flavobacterium sp. j3]|uniref:NfeD family protein n=1 Tax=Flavobacterium aureirubrum TaxID=3133147 RepID=A0ABU9N7X0_9FLAO